MFAFCHLVISGISWSCHWLVLEPLVSLLGYFHPSLLDDWVSPGTDCWWAALLLSTLGAVVFLAPSNVILWLSLWTWCCPSAPSGSEDGGWCGGPFPSADHSAGQTTPDIAGTQMACSATQALGAGKSLTDWDPSDVRHSLCLRTCPCPLDLSDLHIYFFFDKFVNEYKVIKFPWVCVLFAVSVQQLMVFW